MKRVTTKKFVLKAMVRKSRYSPSPTPFSRRYATKARALSMATELLESHDAANVRLVDLSTKETKRLHLGATPY